MNESKQCFKCKETKPLTEFYTHPMMADGHLGKCKTCARRDVAERVGRLENNPDWLAKERERCRIKMARYRMSGRAKKYPAVKTKWEQQNRIKKRAQCVAKRAMERGEIERKTTCESCGDSGRLHKHHPNYSLPKLVVWLCPKCHGIAHRKPFGAPIHRQ